MSLSNCFLAFNFLGCTSGTSGPICCMLIEVLCCVLCAGGPVCCLFSGLMWCRFDGPSVGCYAVCFVEYENFCLLSDLVMVGHLMCQQKDLLPNLLCLMMLVAYNLIACS